MKTFILIIVAFMDCADSQYPDCVTCPDGEWPRCDMFYLFYYCCIFNVQVHFHSHHYHIANTIRSNVFNGTQPSNKGCNNGAIVSGRVTMDCGQGTTLIDCDQGYNDNPDYSDLSNYFIWRRNEQLQVSIVFRFYQQIMNSRISMFFWNSQSNSIIIPNVRMYRGDYFDGSNVLSNQITITTSSPDRTGDRRHRLNIDINNGLQFQYLRIEMSFYINSEWIFLGEVQFCGE